MYFFLNLKQRRAIIAGSTSSVSECNRSSSSAKILSNISLPPYCPSQTQGKGKLKLQNENFVFHQNGNHSEEEKDLIRIYFSCSANDRLFGKQLSRKLLSFE